MPPEVPIDVYSKMHVSIANIGPYKTGKTSALISFHDWLIKQPPPHTMILVDTDIDGAGPVIADAIERGWSHQLRIFRPRTELPNGIVSTDQYPIRDKEPFLQFATDLNQFENMVDYNTHQWQQEYIDNGQAPGVIVIDSYTGYEEMSWDFILATRKREIAHKEGSGSIEYDEWRLLQENGTNMIKNIKSKLPCHLIVNFHEQLQMEEAKRPKGLGKGSDQQIPVRDVITGAMWYLPQVNGQLAGKIGKNFGAVIHSRVRNGEYVWVIRPSEEEHIRGAGTRLRKDLPPIVLQDYNLILT